MVGCEGGREEGGSLSEALILGELCIFGQRLKYDGKQNGLLNERFLRRRKKSA